MASRWRPGSTSGRWRSGSRRFPPAKWWRSPAGATSRARSRQRSRAARSPVSSPTRRPPARWSPSARRSPCRRVICINQRRPQGVLVMHDKERDLMRAFARGGMDRRELLRSAARLGLSAAAAGYLLNEAQTEAQAADFDWQANKGKTVNLLLNKHPYADAMIADLDAFKKLSGMDVKYDVFPEDVYFDKVNAALSSGSDQYDAFMTGAYQTWGYGPAGWIVDLNEFIS